MNGYKLLKQAEKGLEIRKPASKQLKPLLRYYLSRNMKDQLIRAQSVMATKRHASLEQTSRLETDDMIKTGYNLQD